MIATRYLSRIVAVVICVCLLFCGFIVYAANAFDTTQITEYQRRMFGDEVMTIDNQVDADEWEAAVLDNATAKEWISADLIIDGQRFSAVGIRTKGNSSLSTAGFSSGDNRYSLQFKANKYVKGQTFYGLDTFSVNNMMGDATYMKDYIAYEIMDYIGVAAPLRNYAKVTVNGEDYGFGVALERYDKAFLDRVYSTSAGQLYNVKIAMGMRGDFEDLWRDSDAAPDVAGGFPGGMPGGGRGGAGGFGSSGGGSLIYTGDDISSYGAIFNNAVFNPSDNDKMRVITALENLNAGTDLEKYIDVDAALRYFAAHTVVVNLDSYTSNMAQNYYLYERDGKLTILPWDYNLAFGGFMSGNASSTVNYPIDTPVSGVSMEDRPLLNMLLTVDAYRERYHDYLRQIVEGYFESGLFENTIRALDTKINEYVRNDVNTYHSREQYEASLPVFVELGRLRAKSIRGQLDGTIPSTSRGQSADSSSLIDASGINLSALGSMSGGRGGFPGGEDGMPGGGRFPGGGDSGFPGGDRDGGSPGGGFDGFPGGMFGGEMPDMSILMEAMQIIMGADGELTDEDKEALLDLGLTEEQIEMFAGMPNGFPGGGRGGNAEPPQQGINRPGGSGSAAEISSRIGLDTGYIATIGVLILILIGATLLVARPKKTAL